MTVTDSKHIGQNGVQCHIEDGERILKAALLPVFHTCELVVVTGKLSKDTDIEVCVEAAFHNINMKQIADPFGVFRIYPLQPLTTLDLK